MSDETERTTTRAGAIILRPVESLNSNDVLFGRGTASNEYVGNQRFLNIVRQRKEAYSSCRQHEPKKQIAMEVLQHVRSLGGRFLRRDESENAVEWSVEEGSWYVVDDKMALEKCKQALRERKGAEPLTPAFATMNIPSISDANNNNNNTGAFRFPPEHSAAALPFASTFGVSPYAGSFAYTTNASFAQSPVLADASMGAVNDRLSLSNSTSAFAFPSHSIRRAHTASPDDLTSGRLSQLRLFNPRPPLSSLSVVDPPVVTDRKRSARTQPNVIEVNVQSNVVASDQVSGTNMTTTEECTTGGASARTASTAPKEGAVVATTAATQEDDVSEFLLSVLALSGRAKFTEEQSAEERASMTNEERARVLADLFGRYCNSAHTRSKRARRDLDKDSIAFLIKQMRFEIEKIPTRKKEAYMEAQIHCRPEEFSDERLERFLRCVDMDVQLAARRFVNYWKCRKDVFGPKFVMRMTLSEALRDDLVALEACVFCLLPLLDASDRQVQYMEPARHTGEGYTSDSLLRAIWYVHEVAAQNNKDVRSRSVQIVWLRNMTLWEYDANTYDRMHQFEANAWPIRVCAFHVCCSPSFVHRILKPILFAVMDKESRSRIVFHDVPEGDVVNALSSFGLSKDLLPTSMGGSLEFDQLEWIANRRAVELEEI